MLLRVRAAGQDPTFASLACDSAVPPLWGGNGYGNSAGACATDPSICSVGFQVEKVTSPTTQFALTAGHCLALVPGWDYGEPAFHRTYEFGTRGTYRLGSEGDVGLVRVLNSSDISDDVHHDGVRVDVNGTQTSNAPGYHRCFTGIQTANTSCGVILDDHTSFTCEGFAISNLIRMEIEIIPGDSGGPLYRYVSADNVARAVGVGSCRVGSVSYHSLVEFVPEAWDVAVSVNP